MTGRKKLNFIAIFVLLLALVLTSFIILSDNTLNLNADAYSSDSAVPATIGELTLTDYGKRTDGKVFNYSTLKTLYTKLTNNSNATYDDVVKKVQGSKSELTGKNGVKDTQNYSMNFQQIKAANGGTVLTVTLDGIKWNVVYLTTNTTSSSNGEGDLIATLWMSTTDASGANVQWNSYSNSSTATTAYSSNNYSLSMVRVKTLNGGPTTYSDTVYATSTTSLGGNVSKDDRANNIYAKYTLSNEALTSAGKNDSGNNLSLVDYLATPSQLRYQEKESFNWAFSGNLNVSEAWGTPSSGSWLSTVSMGNVTSQASSTANNYYKAWAEKDHIWLPSMTETGFYSAGAWTCASLWGINDLNVLKSSADIWTRSGFQQGAANTQYLPSDGSGGNDPVTKNKAIRPAIHLNLTTAQYSISYEDPTDITNLTFNDQSQAPASLTTKPAWWNADFANTSLFTTTYYKSVNNNGTVVETSVSDIKDAGDYWVKLEVNSSYSEGVFWGAPVTTDTKHVESDKVRWFQVKVAKKKIEVEFTETGGVLTVGAKDPNEINVSSGVPTFGIRYTGVGADIEPPNQPTTPGTYTATAVITNPEISNFEIDTTTKSYTKNKTEITKPTIANNNGNFTYKAAAYEFTISNYDTATVNLDTLPDGVSLVNGTQNKLNITNAGQYKIKFTLKDPSLTSWKDDPTLVAVEIPIEIKKKQISVQNFNATLLSTPAVKDALNAKVPAANIIDVIPGDTTPDISIMFGFQDGTGNPVDFYPDYPGKYKATLAMNDPNYELDATSAALEVNFDVTGEVQFKKEDLVWIATPNAGGDTVPLDSPYELPFILGGYTISISPTTKDKMSLTSKGVKIYTEDGGTGYSGDVQATNAGNNYSVSVRIVNYDNTFDNYDETITLNYKILTHQVTKPSYSGGDITFSKDPTDLAMLFGLPSDWADYVEFEVKKNGDPFTGTSISDVGIYDAVIKFKSDMTSNAVWSDKSSFPVQLYVKIIPRNIEITDWENTTGIPSPITDDPDGLDYLDYEFTKADGTSVTKQDVNNSINTTFNVKAVSKYGDNVVVSAAADTADNQTFSTPGNPNVPATPIDKPTLVEDSKEYTGDELTFELDGFDNATMMIMDGTLTVTDVGEYSIIIRFKDGVNYCWNDNTRDPIMLTFSVTEQTVTPPPAEEGPSFLDKIKQLIDSGFPLWQIVTMSAGGLLGVIFLIKSIQYGNRRKKLAGKKNSVKVAGLLPVFSSEVVLAGLSNQIWSIMAFAFAGFAVIMFIVALITRKAWKKAELAAQQDGETSQLSQIMQALQQGNQLMPQQTVVDNTAVIEEMRREMERQRIEMEERHREEMARRDEEQAKRDEAMKLMLARMMGRAPEEDGDMPYYGTVDDTDLLVQKVIAGLLPAVQQMIPETTAYLTAPAYEQSENDIEAIADRVAEKLDRSDDEIRALTDEVKDLKKQLAKEKNTDNSLDVDDLAQKVAAQITPAQTSVNLDDLAQKVSAKITPVQQNPVDVDEIVQKVSAKITPVA
ncbi:MAG: hypothetical protein NC179_06015, partial [[Eubacterium] siraeum]|nr:hypothetical protein [[Eubacterium] siraeum]